MSDLSMQSAAADLIHTARPAGARRAPKEAPLPFADILCAVDGSRGSREAMHQAIALSGRGGTIGFVAVRHERGTGLSAQADLSEMTARNALDEAASIAGRANVEASIGLLRNGATSDLLLAEAAEHDLLVIGSHGGSRLGGIMLGSTATQVAHRAEGPVLIARRTADGMNFPHSVLLASDVRPAHGLPRERPPASLRQGGPSCDLSMCPTGCTPSATARCSSS